MDQPTFFSFARLFRDALALAAKAFPVGCVYRAQECFLLGRFARDKYDSPVLIVSGVEYESVIWFRISGKEARLEIHEIPRGGYGADVTVFVSLLEHGAEGGISTTRMLPDDDVCAVVKATAQHHCAVTIRGVLALQIAGYYGDSPLRLLSKADAHKVLTSLLA